MGTMFGLLTIGWTAAGIGVAAAILRAPRGDVVVVGPAGIRTERLTRRGHRVVADLAWDDVREARLRPGTDSVEVLGAAGATRLSTAGSRDQNVEIQWYVSEHVATLPDRPPIVAGTTAYLDDRGATLLESRAFRRNSAVVTGAGAVLCGVNAAALAADGVWPVAGALAAATVGLL